MFLLKNGSLCPACVYKVTESRQPRLVLVVPKSFDQENFDLSFSIHKFLSSDASIFFWGGGVKMMEIPRSGFGNLFLLNRRLLAFYSLERWKLALEEDSSRSGGDKQKRSDSCRELFLSIVTNFGLLSQPVPLSKNLRLSNIFSRNILDAHRDFHRRIVKICESRSGCGKNEFRYGIFRNNSPFLAVIFLLKQTELRVKLSFSGCISSVLQNLVAAAERSAFSLCNYRFFFWGDCGFLELFWGGPSLVKNYNFSFLAVSFRVFGDIRLSTFSGRNFGVTSRLWA